MSATVRFLAKPSKGETSARIRIFLRGSSSSSSHLGTR
jgi:hypothetical protein